jgi:NADH:ubiquinone oxidoreductase subunit 5 (subunit L)/multisubunit Na+/H+ antiporter MnhA subunit
MEHLAEHFHGAAAMGVHSLTTLPFILALAGVVLSWFFYMKRPDIPAAIQRRFSAIYTLLENKYYFDKFNEVVFAGGARLLGKRLWKGGDVGVDRRRHRQWFQSSLAGFAHNPLLPDRLRLSLRFHHDHRRVCADDPVDQPR